MEKLNNTAKVLEELRDSIDNTLGVSYSAYEDINNMESVVNMANQFTESIMEFPFKDDVIAGYKIMISVLEMIGKKLEDVNHALGDAEDTLRDII